MSKSIYYKNRDFYICVNDTPWQYHFEINNYILLDEFLEDGRREDLNEKCLSLNLAIVWKLKDTIK